MMLNVIVAVRNRIPSNFAGSKCHAYVICWSCQLYFLRPSPTSWNTRTACCFFSWIAFTTLFPSRLPALFAINPRYIPWRNKPKSVNTVIQNVCVFFGFAGVRFSGLEHIRLWIWYPKCRSNWLPWRTEKSHSVLRRTALWKASFNSTSYLEGRFWPVRWQARECNEMNWWT